MKKINKLLKKNLLKEDALPLFQKKNKDIQQDLNLNLCNFGKLNPKKFFYVIRRSPGAGLLSIVLLLIEV